MTEKEALVYIRAAMIMLNQYGDLLASAELFEIASKKYGKKEVEELVFELADATMSSRSEIVQCKGELDIAKLRGYITLSTENN